MLSRLLQLAYNMYEEGVHPTLENKPEQILQSPYAPLVERQEIENTLGERKINMDSRDIAQVVSDLTTLLGDAERIQEETSTKVDELTEIKDGLEEANGNLGEALSALEGLEDIVDTVENLLNDADSEGIN